MQSKLTSITFLILLINSCSNQNKTDEDENNTLFQSIDSTELYSFFADKISSTWDYSPDNDSVVFEFNEHDLPESRSETKLIGSKSVHLSIEYTYNISDSTETVKHLQQFGGGHSLTEIRKFGPRGNVIWKEEIDVNHNHTRIDYDEKGLIKSTSILP